MVSIGLEFPSICVDKMCVILVFSTSFTSDSVSSVRDCLAVEKLLN